MARNRKNTNDDNDDEDLREEVDKYRRAAEDALQQLDWAIGYLHGIRKTDISTALAQNRTFIRKRLLDQPEEPLPSQQTNET